MKQNQKDSLTIMYWGIAGMGLTALFQAYHHLDTLAVASALGAGLGLGGALVRRRRGTRRERP